MEYWPDDDVKKLREYVEKGLTAKQIGILLGKTRNAVIGAIHRHRFQTLAPRPAKKEDRAVAVDAPCGFPSPPEQPAREARVADGLRLPQTDKQCRWPFGDPRDKDFHFCTNERSWNSPYCDEHHRMAYQGIISAYRRGQA
jgi:GcrA cell cycle regulator